MQSSTHVIMTSRFTEKTLTENRDFCMKNNVGCIYCTPTPITEKVPAKKPIFVLEMNNTKNEIAGIGVIIKKEEQNIFVYETSNYNRYGYIGKYHIDRSVFLSEKEIQLLEILDKVCFRGKRHLKRGRGILLFPKSILKEMEEMDIDVLEILKLLFRKKFRSNTSVVCSNTK